MQENLTLVNKSLPSPLFFSFLFFPADSLENNRGVGQPPIHHIPLPSPCHGKSVGEGFRLTYFQDLLFKLFSDLCAAAMTG